MTEPTVNLSIDVAESLLATAKRLHPGNLKPRDREKLELAEQEVERVRRIIDLAR